MPAPHPTGQDFAILLLALLAAIIAFIALNQ